MSSIDQKELFEKYYQSIYDFNTSSLTGWEIAAIKQLAREKRVDYALAPMGTGVFNWIINQNPNIRIELVAFESERIDGLLYIPRVGKEKAYIVLNSNKPLINQIFTAAHEYYHYLKDYQKFKEAPYICDFSALKDVNEKKACRFGVRTSSWNIRKVLSALMWQSEGVTRFEGNCSRKLRQMKKRFERSRNWRKCTRNHIRKGQKY